MSSQWWEKTEVFEQIKIWGKENNYFPIEIKMVIMFGKGWDNGSNKKFINFKIIFFISVNRSFYVYVTLLALLNGTGSIGCSFLLVNITEGLCIVDVTTFLYFTLFTPLVYITFLSTFFRWAVLFKIKNVLNLLFNYNNLNLYSVSQSSIMFSYKAQNDDRVEDDTVSLPHQPSFSSLKTDSDYIYQVSLKIYRFRNFFYHLRVVELLWT